MEHNFYFKNMTVCKLWLFQLKYLPENFQKNEQNEPDTSKKTSEVFVANDKTETFKGKQDFCKTSITVRLTAFQ